jgi:cobalt ECF transporter T component CbiQ/cobalamin biosynthesis protein CbiM
MPNVAMHIANGIIEGPVAAGFAAVALVGLAICLARGRGDLDDRLAPMAGLAAAFIFAVQMLNFPIFTAAVSGHLLGGTLAAMLVGPWIGALCVSVVLIVQSLVFADGGVTALGLNITNMAFIGTAAGYLLVAALLRVLPRTKAGLWLTAFLAAMISVVVASMGFVVQFAIGGAVDVGSSIAAIAATLGGVHLLIGIGEGLITAMTVVAVAKVRPDLVYALRRLQPAPLGEVQPAPKAQTRPAREGVFANSPGWFIAGGLLVALLLAGVVSNFASSQPDGLDSTTLEGCTVDDQGAITGGTCIAQGGEDHELADGPLADYGVSGIDNSFLSTGMSGVVGVLLTFAIGGGIFWLVRRRRSATNRDLPGKKPTTPSPRSTRETADLVGAGRSHGLHLDRATPVHRLAPEVKIVAMVLFTIAVVVTPREAFWAFGLYAVMIAVVAALARVTARWLLIRSLIELPFVVLALALPFLAGGERVTWLGVSLSVPGLYGGWNILAKGTLGVLASLLLAATTTTRDLVLGLDRLRCPQVLTQIATFMLRYLAVLTDEVRRMRIARISRGDDPRFLWQLKGFAAGIGALFLRAYERGERVYLAMISRGYTGRMPPAWLEAGSATTAQWVVSATVPVVAAAIAVAAFVIR